MAVNIQLSLSATYDDARAKFSWHEYTGSRGVEISQRTHSRMLRKGDVFGLKSIRGGRYYVILPEMYHVDFPVLASVGDKLRRDSKQLDGPPELVSRDGRAPRSSGVKSTQRALIKSSYDTARFKPRQRVPAERTEGIDFDNYQWRIITDERYKLRHSRGYQEFRRNDVVGVRFRRPASGGFLVDQDGMFLVLPTEDYDKFVEDTMLLQLEDWPTGTVDATTVREYKAVKHSEAVKTAAEKREEARLRARAERLAARKLRREERQTAREEAAAKAEEDAELHRQLAEARRLKREEDLEASRDAVYSRENTAGKYKSLESMLDEEELLEEDEEDLEDFGNMTLAEQEDAIEERDLDDLFSDVSFGADVFSITSTFGSIFDDEEEEDAPGMNPDEEAFDIAEEDEDDDDSELGEDEDPNDKLGKLKDDQDEDSDVEEDESEEEVEEEDPDADGDESEESEEESEEEVEEDEDLDEDESEEEVEEDEDADAEDEDADAEDEDLDAEEESEEDVEEDEDLDAEDEDADGDESEEDSNPTDEDLDSGDDDSDSDEEDEDVNAAEDEDAKQKAKDTAKKNSNKPESPAANPEEGDVLNFRADKTLKRDFVILNVEPHKSSDQIYVFTLYDITGSPDEVRKVRINRARNQSLFDIAVHVKDMKPALFNQVIDLATDYPVNNAPIES